MKQHDGLLSQKDFQQIKIAKLSLQYELLYKIDSLVDNVEFAFFGIPVENLFHAGKISNTLGDIIHYFYDLRHVFDLFYTKTGDKEFYLFEYALKEDNFRQSRVILNGKPASLNLTKLLPLIQTHNVETVKKVIANVTQGKPIQDLDAKGYQNVAKIKNNGDYRCFVSSNGDPVIEFLPLRNVYPYSFAGIIDKDISKDGKEYLLLAVTTGQGGVRSGVFNKKLVFTPPLEVGFTIEEAVEAIHLLLYDEKLLKDRISNIQKLILLDQGGDVHQWTAAEGLKDIVKSSTERPKLSAEIFVGIKK